MEKFVSNLWPGMTGSIIATIIVGAVVFFWKWLSNLLQPSKVVLPAEIWYSYYYKFENNQAVLKTDKWKIKKSALESSSYHVRIINSGKDLRKRKGWTERLKKRWEDTVDFLWNINGRGKMVLDHKDSCYTARLRVGGIYPVYIRFHKPTEDRKGNNILRGVALATDENHTIRSGVNILASNKLSPDELMEILKRTSKVNGSQRFLRLEPLSLNGS